MQNNNPTAGSGTGGSSMSPGTGGNGTGGTTSPGTGGTTSPGTGGSTGAAPGTGGSAGGIDSPVNCTPGVPATSQIPRLTNAQYDRTIRDLLNVTNLIAADNVKPSTRLATDQDGAITALAWANYKDVADKIATQVMGDPNLKGNFLKCTPVAGDNTCLHNTVIEFGRRAFRRPLTTEEIARFDTVIASGAAITQTGTPEEVAQVLLYMFLISPSFLQRSEIAEVSAGTAGQYALNAYEIASRLSYMLWGSTPDTLLDQAVDSGQLSTPQQIADQAQRMLQDPKARDMVNSFHRHYLAMRAEGRWDTANREPTLYPTFNPAVVPDLTLETLLFFDKVAFTPGATWSDFLTSPVAFVNQNTAQYYGLNPAQFGADLTETTLDATQRPGFLTRLGFLMNFASYTRTNPIYRGAFITKDVLGITLDPPPQGATDTPLPSGATLDTNRKQVEAQTSAPDCVGCHSTYVNPPGFVMEAFDAVGAYRTAEANGVALNTVADVTIEDGQAPVSVSTPAQLMALIASSPGAMRHYAKKWVGYAYERESHPDDVCTVDQIAAKMAAGNYPVLNLITDLTQAQAFRVRAVEVTP